MDVLSDIIAIMAVAGTLMQAAERQQLCVVTDPTKECQYVIGGTSEGLHVVINGPDHCRTIRVDGMKVEIPERRAAQ